MYDLVGTLVDTKLIAKENIQASQQLQKERHDRKIKNEQLQEGDLVLEYRSKDQNIYSDKFQPKWDGPFVINTKLGKEAYILRTMNGKIIQNRPVYGNQLKKYYQQEIVEQTFLNNILL